MFLNNKKPFLMAGPCVIESKDNLFEIADRMKEITTKLGFDYIFKASFDKANRTSVTSYRGPGLDEGLKMLSMVKKEFDLPIVTDIHEANQAKPVSEVADVLQIPAFLCRQTDLLVESGKTGKIVNIKKAQFLSGKDMLNAVKKVESTGNKNIMLTERGNMYGYNNLVVDFRNILDMKEFGYPVIIDATHSTQRPGGEGQSSGGDPKYASYFAKAATVCGVDGYFFEVHPEPSKGLSDATNMISLNGIEKILKELKELYDLSKKQTL
ncbi:MAG: 2-dehydro-3-deoxyphosphooctonate aldolase synthase [Campylobacterota bacterium]|nr:2-dehydro-3-deoxyphosphooctonate aldolase synthase [Campylobacterota bacterium]